VSLRRRAHSRSAGAAHGTSCNCSICRRYGALWAYNQASSVRIAAPRGALSSYSWRHKISRVLSLQDVRLRHPLHAEEERANAVVAVNASNFELDVMKHVRIRKLDGADTWKFLS